ncbi:MAG: hypothetical protein ABW005_00610 [Burkholderiaceae bacterium]
MENTPKLEHITGQHHGRWYHADGRLDGHLWRPAYAILHTHPHNHDGLAFVGGESVIGDETFSTREDARHEAILQARVAIDTGH